MQAARGTSLSDASEPGAGQASRSPRRVGVLVAVALVVFAVDQVAKVLAVDELTARAPVRLAGGLLTLRLTRNPGAAFGLAAGATLVFSLVALVVVLVVLRTARRLRSATWAVALGLLLGGALGNLADRLLRSPGALRGHVVDFLELPHWPIFNVADMCIVTAAALMVLLSLLGRQVDGTRAVPSVDAAGGGGPVGGDTGRG